MTIKIDLKKFSNSQFLKKCIKKNCFKGVCFPLIKFGNLNQNIIKIPTKKQMKEKENFLDIQLLKERILGSISIKTWFLTYP